MPFITFFSTPKPFTKPHTNTIQRNAIQSWLRAGNDIEVLLIGEEEGLAEVAAEYGVRHLPNVARNLFGTPLISSIFQLAHEASDSELMVYVNTDIILPPNFQEIVQQVANQADDFLAVGHRWDFDLTEKLDFSENWDENLQKDARAQGKRRGSSSIDYFIFPRKFYTHIPDFAIGRTAWDNWMIFHAHEQKLPVIILTSSLMVIHQNHGFGHVPGGKNQSGEAQKNLTAAGGRRNIYYLLDATHEFRHGKIRRVRWSLVKLIRHFERWTTPEEPKGKRWYFSRRLFKTWVKLEQKGL